MRLDSNSLKCMPHCGIVGYIFHYFNTLIGVEVKLSKVHFQSMNLKKSKFDPKQNNFCSIFGSYAWYFNIRILVISKRPRCKMTRKNVLLNKSETLEVPVSVQKKFDNLKNLISQTRSAAIAFSGGVDSTFLLKVCSEIPGYEVMAITAESETFPELELEQTKLLAKKMSIPHIIIRTEELSIPGYSDNPPDRCFMCKNELFSKMKPIADQYFLEWMFDGSNADDVDDFRPGRKAARKLGVRSPLEEAGLGKLEIRMLSRMLDLPTWDKPSFACLSSRFPYFSKITPSALKQVERGENYLRQIGMRIFRVRHHDTLARIEAGENEMRLVCNDDIRNQTIQHFKSIGYKYITMDLEGYRSGSMNEAISNELKHDYIQE